MAKFAIPADQVRKMQMVGLKMALVFDEFCEKHGLTYYMCGGCCIGSQRNKGFIPWDDDVDVFMPRSDYEKLKELWVDTEKYSIQYTTKDFITQNQFLTICDNDTTFIKTYQKDLDINHGVVLDVLPLDGCPTGWRRKTQKLWALLYSLFIVGKAPTNHGKLVTLGGKVLLTLVKPKSWRYKAWRLCERKMSQYPIEKCDYITELCSGPHYMQNEYPKEFFEKPLRVEFEGHQLPIPVGYDGYLRMAFGDYLQLPPEEKRVCHHEYEFMDMENSYKNYRGKYYYVNQK
jgi:lipopolysaccharide cholinephosphotransferase